MIGGDEVGTLQRLGPREVFCHEAYDFTTWMKSDTVDFP